MKNIGLVLGLPIVLVGFLFEWAVGCFVGGRAAFTFLWNLDK